MSTEFEVGGQVYRARLMPAIEQWQLLRRLAPLLPALSGMDYGLRAPGVGLGDITRIMAPLISASDEDAAFVFGVCRGACERRDGETWVAVADDLQLSELLAVTMEVVDHNLGRLFRMKRPRYNPEGFEAPKFTPVTMPDAEDWFWRPFVRDKCRYVECVDGTLQIHDIAKINDLLDVSEENDVRARNAAERKR